MNVCDLDSIPDTVDWCVGDELFSLFADQSSWYQSSVHRNKKGLFKISVMDWYFSGGSEEISAGYN